MCDQITGCGAVAVAGASLVILGRRRRKVPKRRRLCFLPYVAINRRFRLTWCVVFVLRVIIVGGKANWLNMSTAISLSSSVLAAFHDNFCCTICLQLPERPVTVNREVMAVIETLKKKEEEPTPIQEVGESSGTAGEENNSEEGEEPQMVVSEDEPPTN
ncbi:unnamed protein product [Microthlaspi erraticum]|uniref:Uncharacterized protein n=1 Tax=Microthlaspi erraticum TaxID=1685480 RepID=A0A6D2KW55_9BRAS|nr:unnamed protein product [Microthlaspi erraticum]